MKTHRKKVYDELKKYGLTNKANELFGHNFTQVSSNKLEKLIKEYKANLQVENKMWEAVDASQSCDEHGCHFDTHTAEISAAKAVKNIEAYENKVADIKVAEAAKATQVAQTELWPNYKMSHEQYLQYQHKCIEDIEKKHNLGADGLSWDERIVRILSNKPNEPEPTTKNHEPSHSNRWYEDMLEKMKEKGLIRNIDELRNFFKKSEPKPRKYDIQEILDRLDTIICLLRNMH